MPQAPEYRGFHKTGFASLGGCAGGSRSGLWGTPPAALPDRWALHRTLPLASQPKPGDPASPVRGAEGELGLGDGQRASHTHRARVTLVPPTLPVLSLNDLPA